MKRSGIQAGAKEAAREWHAAVVQGPCVMCAELPPVVDFEEETRSRGLRSAENVDPRARLRGSALRGSGIPLPPFGHRQAYAADLRRLDPHHLIPKGTLIRGEYPVVEHAIEGEQAA